MRQAGYPVEYRVAAKTLVVLNPSREVVLGAQAVFFTISRTEGLFGLVCNILAKRIPSLLVEPVYRQFAKHRGRFAFLISDSSRKN